MLDKDGNHIPGMPPEGSQNTQPAPAACRTTAEIGSPEFAEALTQVNGLNGKLIFRDEMGERANNEGIRSQLATRMVRSFDDVLNTGQKLDALFLQGMTDRARFVEGWEYNRAYDLANPVAVATGNNLTAGAAPANRITDTTGAVAGGAVNAAVGISALNNVTAQVGILQTMVSELAQSQNTTNLQIAAAFDQVLSILGKVQATVAPVATPAPAVTPTAGA